MLKILEMKKDSHDFKRKMLNMGCPENKKSILDSCKMIKKT